MGKFASFVYIVFANAILHPFGQSFKHEIKPVFGQKRHAEMPCKMRMRETSWHNMKHFDTFGRKNPNHTARYGAAYEILLQ